MPSRTRAVLLVAFGVLVLAAAAIGTATWDAQTPTSAASPRDTSGASTPPTGPPTPTGSPTPSIRSVQLAFAGDVHFEEFLRTALLADPTGLLAPAAPLLAGADHVVVNLETAVTTRGTPWPKTYNFRAPPEAFVALLAGGIDAVSLANNHTLDFREIGLLDTLDHAAAAGMPTFGAGRDLASALAPHSVSINGLRIAFLGAAEVLTDELWVARDATDDGPARAGMPGAKPHHLPSLLPAIERAAATHDVVVVYLHWGEEENHCPVPRQTSLAPKLVDAGADIVVGTHAHRVQGFGFIDDALVHYGLGNFVWYTGNNEGGRSGSGVLHVRIEPDGTMTPEWRPAEIVDGIPVPVAADEAPRRHAQMRAWMDCAGF
ncbi:MAG: CapA family protein [Nitriliruptorales bacterium]|nr:CapA family protein [Nitriliruptorales bacterium]